MMCFLHVVIKRSSRPSINPFLVTGHIAGKHHIYIMGENICGDVLKNTCPGTLQTLFTHFSSSKPNKWFPCIGKFRKNRKS